jgi:selenocysteine-specific elongation factor
MKSIVVGTAGHIDHGKSALVRALTGTDPDRLKEEKARGITIDLGFAHLALGDLNVAFVDVPGHERFVKNMLAGVGGIDMVVLVVAADESVMPQTREHFDICKLLRIPSGIVAITKSDLADQDTRELTSLEVRELVAGSFLEPAPVVPVSVRTGEGLDELRGALSRAASAARVRSDAGPVRLPIDRVFSVKGFGTVVTGTLVSGRIRPDDRLSILPVRTGGKVIAVRGVQVHGSKRDEAVAGQRAAINLAGIEVADIQRGQVLVTPGAFEATRVADATLELLPGARPLRHGTRVRFHQGTAEIIGRVAVIGPAAGASAPAIAPGEQGYVRLRLERPAVLTRDDRYILRAYSPPLTIAGGRILDPVPPRTAIRSVAALERSRQLDADADETTAVSRMIDEAGARAFRVSSLVSRAGINPQDVERTCDELVDSGMIGRVGDVLVSTRILQQLQAGILALLDEHHRAAPHSEGVPREEVRERLFRRGPAAVFDRVVDELAAARKLVGGGRLALARHQVTLSDDESRATGAIEAALLSAGLTPPDLGALAADAHIDRTMAERMIQLLVKQKRVVKIDVLYFHAETLRALKERVSTLKADGAAKIDVSTFKERFGVTRKFAIPLLEYLDRERVTRRVGDARVLL